MAALNYLPAFEDDALSIWNITAKDNPAAADELVGKLYARCLLLVDHPLAGPARPDIAKECRHLTLGRYLILYRMRRGRLILCGYWMAAAKSAARCFERR